MAVGKKVYSHTHAHRHKHTHRVTETSKLKVNSTQLFSARDGPCGRREVGTGAQTNATSREERTVLQFPNKCTV